MLPLRDPHANRPQPNYELLVRNASKIAQDRNKLRSFWQKKAREKRQKHEEERLKRRKYRAERHQQHERQKQEIWNRTKRKTLSTPGKNSPRTLTGRKKSSGLANAARRFHSAPPSSQAIGDHTLLDKTGGCVKGSAGALRSSDETSVLKGKRSDESDSDREESDENSSIFARTDSRASSMRPLKRSRHAESYSEPTLGQTTSNHILDKTGDVKESISALRGPNGASPLKRKRSDESDSEIEEDMRKWDGDCSIDSQALSTRPLKRSRHSEFRSEPPPSQAVRDDTLNTTGDCVGEPASALRGSDNGMAPKRKRSDELGSDIGPDVRESVQDSCNVVQTDSRASSMRSLKRRRHSV